MPQTEAVLFTGRLTDTINDAAVTYADADTTGFRRLQDNRNRTYDPKHGRWLQRDPSGYQDGMSLYVYVRSKPTTRVDPHGFLTHGLGPTLPGSSPPGASPLLPQLPLLLFPPLPGPPPPGIYPPGPPPGTMPPDSPPPGPGAAPPSSETACCKYEKGWEGWVIPDTIYHKENRRWQETKKRRSPHETPKCTCSKHTTFYDIPSGLTIGKWFRLRSAKLGPCCSCKIQKRRLVSGVAKGYPNHVLVTAQCSNGTSWYADHPPAGSSSPVTSSILSNYTEILAEYCVSCESAREIRAKADSLRGSPYDWYHDCYWFVRQVLDGKDKWETSNGCK